MISGHVAFSYVRMYHPYVISLGIEWHVSGIVVCVNTAAKVLKFRAFKVEGCRKNLEIKQFASKIITQTYVCMYVFTAVIKEKLIPTMQCVEGRSCL